MRLTAYSERIYDMPKYLKEKEDEVEIEYITFKEDPVSILNNIEEDISGKEEDYYKDYAIFQNDTFSLNSEVGKMIIELDNMTQKLKEMQVNEEEIDSKLLEELTSYYVKLKETINSYTSGQVDVINYYMIEDKVPITVPTILVNDIKLIDIALSVRLRHPDAIRYIYYY